MKLKLLSVIVLFFSFTITSFATQTSLATSGDKGISAEKTLSSNYKMNKVKTWVLKAKFAVAKKVQKVGKFLEKYGMDLNDPVDKYLWYAIIGVVGSVVIFIIAALTISALWYIGYLLNLAGWLSFLYWIYLKFLQ